MEPALAVAVAFLATLAVIVMTIGIVIGLIQTKRWLDESDRK